MRDGVAWLVEHDQCPPVPAHDPAGRRWTISEGEGYGGVFRHAGEVLRVSWSPSAGPAAGEVPGGVFHNGRVSGIVAATGCVSAYYTDEGMSFGVGDEQGNVYETTVRAATADEAAPILTREERAARRAALARQVLELVERADDGTHPPAGEVDPAQMVVVPLRAGAARPYELEMYLDAPRGLLVTTRYNGGDGDDWARNNYGASILTAYPLTVGRARLAADLDLEYGAAEAWRAAGVTPAAGVLLADAGYHPHRWAATSRVMNVVTEADAAAFLARSADEWAAAGWRLTGYIPGGSPAAADAARLADAGITADWHSRLTEAGYYTVADQLAAAPPEVPTTPGVYTVIGAHRTVHSTANPATAAALVAREPASWRPKGLKHHPGLAPVCATPRWQMWTDGAITLAQWQDEPIESGTDAGRALLDLLAAGGPDSIREIPRPRRLELLTAQTFSAPDTIDDRVKKSYRWESGAELLRHRAVLANGETLTVWGVRTWEGGWSGEDGDYSEGKTVHLDEADARARYRKACANLD